MMIVLISVMSWGLHAEDWENIKPPLRLMRNQQLFQCPVCDRQKVAPFGTTLNCQGRGKNHHPEERMIPLGRGN
jgi:hypothetical protein